MLMLRLSLVLALVAGTLLAAGCGGDSDDPTHRYVNHQDRYSVEVPEGWHVSDQTLVPWLIRPKEILSMGTFSRPPGGCKAIGPGDSLISIQENSPARGDSEFFKPRPERFGFTPEQIECVMPPRGSKTTSIDFSDAGRNFAALVVVGSDASKQKAMDVLDSFAPTRPRLSDRAFSGERMTEGRQMLLPASVHPSLRGRSAGRLRVLAGSLTPRA